MDDSLSKPQPIPVSLIIVAALFLISGLSAAIEVVVSLARGHININLSVLGLFIGTGLLRLSPGWRTCALFFLWIGMISIPLVGLLLLRHPGQPHFTVFGQKVSDVPMEFGILAFVVLFLLMVWQYRVLTRRDVRALFELPPR